MSTTAEKRHEQELIDEAAALQHQEEQTSRSSRLIKKIGCKLRRILVLHIGLSLILSYLFMICERPGNADLNYFKSVYWAFTTVFTVGYGDIAPKTNEGILVFIVAIHIWGFLIMPLIIGNIVVRFLPNLDRFRHLEQLWLFMAIWWIIRALTAIVHSKGIGSDLPPPPNPKSYGIDLEKPDLNGED